MNIIPRKIIIECTYESNGNKKKFYIFIFIAGSHVCIEGNAKIKTVVPWS
jgi:hypothetical protein